jgi:hypothetical protein
VAKGRVTRGRSFKRSAPRLGPSENSNNAGGATRIFF